MDFLKTPLKESFRWRDLQVLGVPFETWMRDVPCKSYKAYDMVRPKLKVGVEVEVENVHGRYRPHAALNVLWHPKEDGSLRNAGREFISIPMADQMIPYSLAVLFNDILPPDADFSDRTSIHVHCNVRNWSQGDILNLMLLYIVFEKLLYRVAGPARYKNIFCVPIQETKLPVALSEYLATHSFGALLSAWSKYSGLNLLPIKTMGSVEYRHMEGNRDIERILTWINIIQQLHKAADTQVFERIFNSIRVLNTTSGYEQFVHDTFRGGSHHFAKYDLKKEMEYGVSVVKAIREPSPFLMNLLEGITNEAPLLKSLRLSEGDTKKPKKGEKKPAVDHHAVPDVGAIDVYIYDDNNVRAPRYNWMEQLEVAPAQQQAVQAPRLFTRRHELPIIEEMRQGDVIMDVHEGINLRWEGNHWVDNR